MSEPADLSSRRIIVYQAICRGCAAKAPELESKKDAREAAIAAGFVEIELYSDSKHRFMVWGCKACTPKLKKDSAAAKLRPPMKRSDTGHDYDCRCDKCCEYDDAFPGC